MSGEGIALRPLNYRVNTSPRKYLCGIEDFVRFAVTMYVGASIEMRTLVEVRENMTTDMACTISTDVGDEVFRWHGGAYIEVGYGGGDYFAAQDVINVYDYAAGKPRIPFTVDAFAAEVERYLKERDGDE